MVINSKPDRQTFHQRRIISHFLPAKSNGHGPEVWAAETKTRRQQSSHWDPHKIPVFAVTPRKINIKPENTALEEEDHRGCS